MKRSANPFAEPFFQRPPAGRDHVRHTRDNGCSILKALTAANELHGETVDPEAVILADCLVVAILLCRLRDADRVHLCEPVRNPAGELGGIIG